MHFVKNFRGFREAKYTFENEKLAVKKYKKKKKSFPPSLFPLYL